jgi:hypothetical protein
MKNNKIKRNISTEPPVETLVDKKISSAKLPAEKAFYVKKVQKAKEFQISHLPQQPAYGRPTSCDVTHRFGKRAGST